MDTHNYIKKKQKSDLAFREKKTIVKTIQTLRILSRDLL